jgi:hypothetical protein
VSGAAKSRQLSTFYMNALLFATRVPVVHL